MTLRFGKDTGHNPSDIDCLPWISATEFSPAIVSLGENLGQRASFKAIFSDHKHSDVGQGFDKYHAERGYDPYERGTFWPRFRARFPSLRGRALRWITGFVGQTLAQMETRHFFVESFEGPRPDGTFTIVAKDALKSFDDDRAQAPVLSNGFLVAAIDESVTPATLSPAGIGDAEYPASGHVNIGGNEICAFTRTADALTLTRAQLGTVASSHSEQDRVQLVVRYVEQDPAVIISDLIQTYTDLPASYIPLSAWQTETATYFNRVFTATIAEPTGVGKLIAEIIEQAALALWDDNLAQQLRLQVLRAVPTDAAVYSEANVLLPPGLSITEQADKAVTHVIVYFGQIDPTKRIDDPSNYRSTAETVDAAAETTLGARATRKVFSRWMPQFGRSIAERLGAILIGRYRQAPRKFGLHLLRGNANAPTLGGGYRIDWWCLQDESGARDPVPVQVNRINPQAAIIAIEAEEMRFVAPAADQTARVIVFDFNTNNVNLRSVHNSIFSSVIGVGVTVTFIVAEGIIIGSNSTALPAIDVGDWPVGFVPTLEVLGRVQGRGGDGGSDAPLPGAAGGIALYTRHDIDLDVVDGEIFSGGGGGGGRRAPSLSGGGGGGAGQQPGPGGASTIGTPGSPGTTEAGGAGGGLAGDGGGPGLAGQSSDQAAGGAAGPAIDGVSFVIDPGPGDIRGGQIN